MKDNIVYYQTNFLLKYFNCLALCYALKIMQHGPWSVCDYRLGPYVIFTKNQSNGSPFSELTHLQPASQLNNPMSKPLMNFGQHSVVDQVTDFCDLSIFDGMASVYHVYNTIASDA